MELFEPVEGAFNEGGLMDEGGTIDPASGNDVPIGSTQEEVRDDIPAQLSEGEFVLPADVVRYHGLEKIMELRDEAKAGLAKMEAMGQMGNSEEATLPDDVPFSMDDLEMEDDGIAQYQVGGFVQPPNPLQMQQQVGFTGISGYNPSQFQNYAPQYQQYTGQPLPTSLPTYTAPTQQATPTYTPPNPLPTFGEMVTPTYVIYVNDQGYELSIPVDANGNPLIPVPAGYKKKSEQAEEQPPESQPQPDQPSSDQTGDDGGGGGGPSTPSGFQKSPELQKFESDLDKIKDTSEFKDIYEEFDNRSIFEKARDVVTGANKQYDEVADDIAKTIYNTPVDQRPEMYKELAIAFAEQKEKGPGGIPVIDMTTPEARAKAIAEGTITTSPDQIKDIRETAITDIADTDMSPEAMQAAADELQTGVQSARVVGPKVSAAEVAKTEEQITAEERGEFEPEGIDDKPEVTSEIEGRTTIPADFATTTTRSPTRGAIATDEFADSPAKTDTTRDLEQFERDSRPIRERDRTAERIQAEEFAASSFADEQAAAGRRRESRGKTRTESFESREDYQSNVSKYESRGYSPSNARSAARNKTRADDAARAQTGNPNATAVTSSDGTPVTSTNPDGTKSIVTNDYKAEEQRQSEDTGKSIVCTEMYRQTQLDDWAKAMKIWDVYQKKHLTTAHEIGYHWLFKPYVYGMRNSSILTQLGAYLAQERTKHLKYVITKGRAKDSLVGNLWCKIIHPIVYIAGRIKNG